MRDSQWRKGYNICAVGTPFYCWCCGYSGRSSSAMESRNGTSIDTLQHPSACTEESQQRASRAKQNRKVLNSGPTHFTYKSVDGTYMLSYIAYPTP